MTILTSANKDFSKMCHGLLNSAWKFNYDTVVYDLGGLGFGKKFDKSVMPKLKKDFRIGNRIYWAKSQHKPYIVKETLQNTDDFVAYLDADTLIKADISELERDLSWDVGVTLRRPNERHTENVGPFAHISGYINAGVIFFKANAKAREFVNRWIDEMPKTTSGSDQEALNRTVFWATDVMEHGKIYEWNGIRIKIFSCDEYNYKYIDEGIKDGAKILHFCAGMKRFYDDF